MSWKHAAPTVLATGGVFHAGPILWESFAGKVQKAAPSAAIRRPRFEPIIGPVLLGFRQLGVEFSSAMLPQIGGVRAAWPRSASGGVGP